MSMQISERMVRAGLLCLALAACDGGSSPGEGAAPTRGLADCAIGARGPWRRDCSVDQQGDLLTFRHADGGFRRFHILKDGRGLMAADGAEEAAISIVGKDEVQVSVGEDRYRIPATIGAAARP